MYIKFQMHVVVTQVAGGGREACDRNVDSSRRPKVNKAGFGSDIDILQEHVMTLFISCEIVVSGSFHQETNE